MHCWAGARTRTGEIVVGLVASREQTVEAAVGVEVEVCGTVSDSVEPVGLPFEDEACAVVVGEVATGHETIARAKFVQEALGAEGLRVFGRLALLFTFVALFWTLFDQTAFDVSAQVPPGSWYGTLLRGTINFRAGLGLRQNLFKIAFVV